MSEPNLPDSMLYLWEDHLRIRRSLINPMGITAMSFQELRSYQELYRVKHSSAEVDILIALDAIRIKQMNADKLRQNNGS